MSASIAQRGRFGRGIIATGLAILTAIPCGCRIATTNQLKDSRQSYILAERRGELRRLRRETLQVEEDIRQVAVDLAEAQDQLTVANRRLLPLSTDLAERLRSLKVLEEDLVAARKRAKAALDAQAAVAQARVRAAETQKALASAEAAWKAQTKALQAKQAAVAALTKRVRVLTDLEGQLKKVLAAAAAAVPSVPGAGAGKKQPAKKAPAKK